MPGIASASVRPSADRARATGSRVIEVTSEPAATWDELAVRSPRGEALQSHAWGELKATLGWRALRYRIDGPDGPLAVASVQERPIAAAMLEGRLTDRRAASAMTLLTGLTALAGRFLYLPLGPILLAGQDQRTVDEVEAPAAGPAERTRRAILALGAVRAVARARRAAVVVVDPCWEVDGPEAAALPEAGFVPAWRQVQVSRTGVLVPLDRDEADQHARLSDNVARNLNRARRAGVTATCVDGESAEADREAAYCRSYAILAETGRRVGFELRGEAYHVASTRALVEGGAASLWFARLDGRDVAHTVVHRCGARALLFQSGEPDEALADGRARVPANFSLQWAILRWASAAGFRWYDMGGVDTPAAPGLPADERHPLWGLLGFKRQWGGRPIEFAGAWQWTPQGLRGTAVRLATALHIGA